MQDAFKSLMGGLRAIRQEHLLVAAALLFTIFACIDLVLHPLR